MLLSGEEHAKMTAGAFIREDDTTFHAVEYDPATGERSRAYTFQGYADESCWSRGQAWATYGYAATAKATGKVEDLDWRGASILDSNVAWVMRPSRPGISMIRANRTSRFFGGDYFFVEAICKLLMPGRLV